MSKQNIRVMIFNAGYFTGITGKISEYVTKINLFIFPDSRKSLDIKSRLVKKLIDIINEEQPDILFLSEIHNKNYLSELKDLFNSHHIDIKYSKNSLLNFLPFFRGNSNGIFLKNSLSVEKIYLRSGAKKLVYKVSDKDDMSMFFGHFALGFRTRKKQFTELASLVDKSRLSIIAGDFNIFRGDSELSHLIEGLELEICNDMKEKTCPSFNPKYVLDLFIKSRSVNYTVKVIKEVVLSDHLPVVADFSIKK